MHKDPLIEVSGSPKPLALITRGSINRKAFRKQLEVWIIDGSVELNHNKISIIRAKDELNCCTLWKGMIYWISELAQFLPLHSLCSAASVKHLYSTQWIFKQELVGSFLPTGHSYSLIALWWNLPWGCWSLLTGPRQRMRCPRHCSGKWFLLPFPDQELGEEDESCGMSSTVCK